MYQIKQNAVKKNSEFSIWLKYAEMYLILKAHLLLLLSSPNIVTVNGQMHHLEKKKV